MSFAKHAKTAWMTASGSVGEGPLVLFDYALRFLRVVVLLAIWRTILAGRGPVSGMTLGAILTYTLIAEVFAEQLDARTELAEAFWNGTITTRFLQPQGLFSQFAAMTFGRWALNFALFSLPLLAVAPLLGAHPWPVSLGSGLLFLPSLALAIGTGFAIDFIAFAVLIGTAEMPPWMINQMRAALGALLSGAVIPLALLPWGLGRALEWLPFAATAAAPLQVYTGVGNPLWLLLLQAIWCAVLWPLAAWSWQVNRERLVAHGG